MNMETVSTITLDRKKYEDQFDFEEAVSQIIFTLMRNGYVMTVKREDFDIVVIEFDYQNLAFGGAIPCWLTEDELVSLENTED